MNITNENFIKRDMDNWTTWRGILDIMMNESNGN